MNQLGASHDRPAAELIGDRVADALGCPLLLTYPYGEQGPHRGLPNRSVHANLMFGALKFKCAQRTTTGASSKDCDEPFTPLDDGEALEAVFEVIGGGAEFDRPTTMVRFGGIRRRERARGERSHSLVWAKHVRLTKSTQHRFALEGSQGVRQRTR